MIHYHGADIGGRVDLAHRFCKGRHVMVSFARPAHLEIVAEVCSSFVLDNGAFTTWTKGESFDLDGYYEWCEKWIHHPACDWAVIPDVIDGTAKDNDKLLWQWPFARERGMPVYHFHEPISRLAGLCGWWKRVALGSSGKWPTPGTDSWWERVKEFMPRIVNERGQPYAKLHGLRMLNPEIFRRLPLNSADSANAAINAGSKSRFGLYPHPESFGRSNVIADRIESMPAASHWNNRDETRSLFELQMA